MLSLHRQSLRLALQATSLYTREAFTYLSFIPLLCKAGFHIPKGDFTANYFNPKNLLQHLCQIIDKPFGLIPTKTGVGYRLAVNLAVGDLLCAVLDVALDHKALDYRADLRRITAGVTGSLV